MNLAASTFQADVAGQDTIFTTQVVTETPAALEIGNLTVLGYFKAHNLSSTTGEIIRLKTASGGVEFARIDPGTECLFKWDESIVAPYVTSDAGSPQLIYGIIEA
jgi:hypothetical protein